MDFNLPAIGEGVNEGELVRWLVNEGDSVALDQPLVEIMTDKATVEIPSPGAGKVKSLHAKPGDLVKVGQLLVVIEEGASAQPAQAKPAATQSAPAPAPSKAQVTRPAPAPKPAPAAQPRPAPRPQVAAAAPAPTPSPGPRARAEYIASPGQVLATPATRRLARDLGIDLTEVQATGPQGRVTKEDVLGFSGAISAGPQLPAARGAQPAPAPRAEPRPSILTPGQAETLVPFRGVRRKIAEAMVRSRTTIPEFTYVEECDVTELVEFRNEAKAVAEERGVKLTYLPFVIKAVVRALKEYPYVNASLDEQGGNVVLKNYYNIGVSVDTPDGLMVPVIKNADRKSILEIAGELQGLIEKARTKRIALEDLQGGTFSITSPGNIGGIMSAPIINWPEVGILGMHKISKRPVVRNGQIVVGDVVWLSIVADHRVVDGAVAARFMNVVVDYLSHPKKLMLDMS